MAMPDEFGALTKAFSELGKRDKPIRQNDLHLQWCSDEFGWSVGLGVEEKSLISILGKWHAERRQCFRRTSREIFIEDERQFERWDDRFVQKLHREFLRFKEAVVLWTMHPCERDACLLWEAVYNGAQSVVLIEIACTRSSEELLGARRAYHSLFDHSVEEDIAFRIQSSGKRELLIELVNSYRYEGPKVRKEIAKSEAKIIHNAINDAGKNPIEEEEAVRILTTRSKLHLKSVYQHYKEISGNHLDEDLGGHTILKQAVQCLCLPQTYFSEILDASLKSSADDIDKEAVTRVIVTRADVDTKLIKEEYHHKHGVFLSKKIEEMANGNYRDFLLTLTARGD